MTVVEAVHDELSELRDRVQELEARVEAEKQLDAVSIVCFSGEWDRLFAALVIANGALSMGKETHLFLTFWGAAALRDGRAKDSKSPIEHLIGKMLPGGTRRARLSRLHWLGFGKRFFSWRMRRRGVQQLDELLEDAKAMGVKIHLCEMSADLLGLGLSDFENHGDVSACGVASFLGDATKGKLTLFI